MIHLSELISAYLDGETSGSETARVIAHLQACERCRAELSDVHAGRSALRSLPVLEMPAGLFEDLGVASTVVPMRRRPVTWVAAAAAAIVIFITTATLATPDSIGVTLNDVSMNHEQQQLMDPGIAPKLAIFTGIEQ